jgi:hypothetical protein
MEKNEYTVYMVDSKYGYINTGKNLITTNETTVVSVRNDDMSADKIKNVFGYIYRYNTQFRLKMQHYIDKFRASTHPIFHSNQSCVFVHLRKDDRTLPDKSVNILEWCKKHTRKNEKTG